MKSYSRSFFTLSLLFVLLFLLAIPLAKGLISNGMNATNLVGQLDGGGAPVYTQNYINKGPGNNGFNLPNFTAVDTVNHRLFVSDTSNNRVLVHTLDVNNAFVDSTPDFVLGQSTFTGSSASNLNSPQGLAYDSAGNRLFVSDSIGERILIFDVSTITNGETAVNWLSSGSVGTAQDQMQFPRGLAFDSAGNRLFVADNWNNRVLVFDITAITNGEGAVNVLGQTDFVSSVSAKTQTNLNRPEDLAYDSAGNRLFVADSVNNRVMVWDVAAITNGEGAVNVLGVPNFTDSALGLTQSGLTSPGGLTYDSANGRLFVSDDISDGNNRIMVFNVTVIADGENAINVLGQINFTSNATATTQSGLRRPHGLAYDGNGKLFVADRDNNRVMVFDVTAITDGENAINVLGQLDTVGSITYTQSGANSGARNNSFSSPRYSTVDTVNHRLFISDYSNNRVLVFNLNATNNLVDYIADNVLGQANFTSSVPMLTQSGLNGPMGTAYDSARNLLFVADYLNKRVPVFDVGTIIDGENAIYVLGQDDFVTSLGAVDEDQTAYPTDLAYDSAGGRLFAAQQIGNRVTVFDVSVIVNGEDAIYVLGQPDFTTLTSQLTMSGMNDPEGLAYDSAGNRLFVSEWGNNRVTVFDVAAITNGENAVNVLGQPDFTTNVSWLTQNGLTRPKGLSYDNVFNRLFVTDWYNNRVIVYDVAAITNNENAVSVLGQSDFVTANAATTQSGFTRPADVHYDTSSLKLYVADAQNNRVMIFDTNTAPGATSPSSISQATGGTGYVTFQTTISDSDNVDTKLKVEYSDNGGSGWYDPDLVSVAASSGTPDLNDAQAYQIGSSTAIDTSSGNITLTIVWDTLSASNGNGSLDGTVQSDIQIRVTPNDSVQDGTVQASGSFSLDNLDPSGLTALTSSTQTSSSETLNWIAVTETNHNHYEIWYGLSQLDVQNRGGVAGEWDNSDDASLSTRTTTTTIVTGLNGGSNYYFKIWAIDNFGNEHTVADLLSATGGGGGSSSRNSLEASVSLRGSLGSHRDSALVRIVGQLMRGERMIAGRVSLADELRQFTSLPPRDIIEITENSGLSSFLLQLGNQDEELKELLRGQQTEHLIMEVWETTKVGEPYSPVAKVENISTNLFGEASFTLPRLKIQSYTFTISKPLGLRQTLENVELASQLVLAFPQPVRVGDFDGDGIINTDDFQKFISDFKSRHNNPGDYDLNEDGELNLMDFAEMLHGLRKK